MGVCDGRCAMGGVLDCQQVETVRMATLHLATASNSQACGIKLGLTHLCDWHDARRCRGEASSPDAG